MTEMVRFTGGAGTGLMNREDLAKSLNNAAVVAPRVGGDYQYLKLDKGNGDWLYGQEETVVEEGSLWAVNPMSLMYGYIAWDTDSGGAPVQEVMVPVSRPLPPMSSLPELPKSRKGDALEYQYQQSVDLVCISGEDEGTICQYKQSSVGAMKLFNGLINAISTQVSKGDDIVPIIEMKSDSYKHKKYGKIFNPIFDIKEWRTIDDNSAPAPAEEAPAKEPEPETRAPRVRSRPPAAQQTAPQPPAEGSPEEDEALAKEYAAAQENAPAEQAPRRRLRR